MLPLLFALNALAGEAADFDASLLRLRSDELSYYWAPELLGTGALVVGYFTLSGLEPRAVGGVAELRGLDAAKNPRWSATAQGWSDLLGNPLTVPNLPALSVLGVGVWGGIKDRNALAGVMHSLVVVEVYGVDIAVTEALKLGFSRPRPYTSLAFQEAWPDVYASDEVQDNLGPEGEWDAYKSMPSGHTSGTGAYAFSVATLISRDAAFHGGPRWVAPVSYGAAGALTATVGALRVAAGRHHVTDTLVGGVIGGGIGTGLTWLHTLPGAEGLVVSVEQGAPTLGWSGAW